MFVFEVSRADNGSCHYAQNVSMAACKQIHVHTIWMRSKCATPKERTVCQPCADWFVGEKLADIAPRAPPAELENVREHILDVLFLFPGWRAGTLIVLRNVHVEVSGADSGNCHYAQIVNMVACKGKPCAHHLDAESVRDSEGAGSLSALCRLVCRGEACRYCTHNTPGRD